jgi:predicted nucleic acid-binding protein
VNVPRHRVLFRDAALLDTAAVFAMLDERDTLHDYATQFFQNHRRALTWFAVDTTAHESYTRARYDLSREKAVAAYSLLRAADVRLVRLDADDEERACAILERYADQTLSFQDALCAVIMKRLQIFKVFTFDADFWTLGFEVIPGGTAPRR